MSSHTSGGIIRTIDATSARLITAGQVIVSVASVLKELSENAIDAKCTELLISITDYGLSSIVVSDNGEGFPSPPPKAADSTVKKGQAANTNAGNNKTMKDIENTIKSEVLSNIAVETDTEADFSPLRRRASSKFSFAKIGSTADETSPMALESDPTAASLGFRGEALFSLAQHSDVCIETRNISDSSMRVLTSSGRVPEDLSVSNAPLRFYTKAAAATGNERRPVEQGKEELSAECTNTGASSGGWDRVSASFSPTRQQQEQQQQYVTIAVAQRRPPHRIGTTVHCYNLFKRYPVRLADYIKNKKKYLLEAARVVKLLAVAHPEVRVIFEHRETANAKVERLVATGGSKDRFRTLSEVFGGRLTNTLQAVKWTIQLPNGAPPSAAIMDTTEANDNVYKEEINTQPPLMPTKDSQIELLIEGYISNIGSGRSSGEYQTLILDGRVVGFPKLFTALTEVYRHSSANCDSRTFPAAFLWLSTFNNLSIDVNLAPNKEKILVAREGELVTAVAEAAAETFRGNVAIVPIVAISNVGKATSLASASGTTTMASSAIISSQHSGDAHLLQGIYKKDEVKLQPLGSQVLLPSQGYSPIPMAFSSTSAVVMPTQSLKTETNSHSSQAQAEHHPTTPFALFFNPQTSESLLSQEQPHQDQQQPTKSSLAVGGKEAFAALLAGNAKGAKGGFADSNKVLPPLPAQVVFRIPPPSTYPLGENCKEEETNVTSSNVGSLADKFTSNAGEGCCCCPNHSPTAQLMDALTPSRHNQNGNCIAEQTTTSPAQSPTEILYDDILYTTPHRLTQLTTRTPLSNGGSYLAGDTGLASPDPYALKGSSRGSQTPFFAVPTNEAQGSVPVQPQPPYFGHQVAKTTVPFTFPLHNKDSNAGSPEATDTVPGLRDSEQFENVSLHGTSAASTSTTIDFNLPAPPLTSQDGALLSSMINKADFLKMRVVGQFNRGFIVVTLPHDVTVKKKKEEVIALPSGDETKRTMSTNSKQKKAPKRQREVESSLPETLSREELRTERILSTFIVDQHASDEKCNYERLLDTLVIKAQPLLRPVSVHVDERELELAIEHKEELQAHGFVVDRQYLLVDESDDDEQQRKDPSIPPKKKQIPVPCSLLVTGVPVLPYETVSPTDVLELTQQLATYGKIVRRMKAVWHSVATRACRSSIMIGKTLDSKIMERILQRMGELEQPWACPHGRPTMRFLGHVRDEESK